MLVAIFTIFVDAICVFKGWKLLLNSAHKCLPDAGLQINVYKSGANTSGLPSADEITDMSEKEFEELENKARSGKFVGN